TLFRVVEDVIRPFAFRQFHTRIAAGGSDYGQSGCARELYRCDTNSAACAVHKHALSRFRISALKQRTVRGSVGNANSGALLEADLVWQAMNIERVAERLLSVG